VIADKKTAVYIRLSSEDDNVDGRKKLESDSVSSQRIMLKSFVMDNLGVQEEDILEYVDDGITGTHFNRHGFQQLQEDMKSGEIGCIVVKDFSRFGRDYLEVGFYIEYIFPLLQIRFISINDSYDSNASAGMTGGMNVALKNLVYNMYSLDLSKKITSAMQTRMKNGTRLPVNARYGYAKGKDGKLVVDPEAAKVVQMIFQMAAEGMSFADITRELNKGEIATCDERKESRGEQIHFQRFETIRKKRWNPTTVSGIIRDEIYIGTRIWGKSRCSMHTGHKAVLNDEADWVRLENHHEAIVDRELFEKANAMHPKKSRAKGETRTNYVLERRKKQPALMICAHCGRGLIKESEHLMKCVDGRTSGDPICRNLVIRRETMEEHILALVHQFVSNMLEERKIAQSNPQNANPETDLAELSKQSRQLSSLKMKLYDDYKDGRIDRDLYKQRAEKIGEQLEAIRQKTEELTRKPVLSEQKYEETEQILGELQALEKFDAEQLRKIIKVIRVHSQDEIEIEWNFDDLFWNRNKNLLDNPV
jgi:DNA invertase Pin-like site-specific DNA recombinase